jgi:hypothetical protein
MLFSRAKGRLRLLLPTVVLLIANPASWGQQLFLTAPEFSAGNQPRFVAVGDFNSDGKDDIAVVSVGDSMVNILLGKGDGTFEGATAYATGGGIGGIVLADLNLDGKTDLVVANQDTVSVLLGNGDGTFQAHHDFPDGGGRSPVIADVNGDGNLDLSLAFVDKHHPAITVLLGNGDGTFQAYVQRSVAPYAIWGLAVADMNGDGKADWIFSASLGFCDSSSSVGIATGNGDGSFQQPVFSPSASCPTSLLIDDFNKDGKKDVVVVDALDTVSVFLGNGDGTLQPRRDYATGSNPVSLTSGDFNGDGKADLVVVNFGGTVSVLMGIGDGSFAPAVDYGTGQGPFTVATGHFHGGAKLDLATANAGSCIQNSCRNGSVSILPGRGDGSFASNRRYDSNAGYTVSAGDLNGDGVPDLALIGAGIFPIPPGVSILIGLGKGVFAPAVNYSLDFPVAMTLADFDGDKQLDLGLVFSIPRLGIMRGNGDGTFQSALDFTTSANGPGIIAFDFDRDGKIDVAIPGGDSVSVLLGDGTFGTETKYNSTGACAIAEGDFNGDGIGDLATSTFNSTQVSILLGNGDGTFRKQADLIVPNATTCALVAGDLNGDGYDDLIVTGGSNTDNNVGWINVLISKGDGTFQPYQQNSTNGLAVSVVTADFDGDGNLDVAAMGDFYASVFLGKGDGTFRPRTDYPLGVSNGALYPNQLLAFDLNNDRKPDLVLAAGVSVTLNSAVPQFFNLSVTETGAGQGTIRIVPGGTRCPSVCSKNLADGTAIVLSATAATGSTFSGWTGGGCVGEAPCGFVLTSDEIVSARFDPSPDFVLLASDPMPATLGAGQSATSTIRITPLAGFNSSVALGCSVAPAPQFAPQCAITPNSITSGTPATLTISTMGPHSALSVPSSSGPLYVAWFPLSGIALCGVVFGTRDQRRRRASMMGFAWLILALFLLPSCGGSGNGGSPGTPAGTYTVTVTGKSGTAHSKTMMLTVQ